MIDTPQTSTTVEASGTLPSGEVITQVITIPHQIGIETAHILVAAFNIVRQLGGLTFDADGGLDFYPISRFTGPIHFAIKTIRLASISEMPHSKVH